MSAFFLLWIALALTGGPWYLPLLGLALWAFLLARHVVQSRQYAAFVDVHDEGLRIETVRGRTVELPWWEVTVVEERTGSHGRRALRVLSEREEPLVLTSELSDFDELDRAVLERARRRPWRRPAWWRPELADGS
jgi:hypothetical protein